MKKFKLFIIKKLLPDNYCIMTKDQFAERRVDEFCNGRKKAFFEIKRYAEELYGESAENWTKYMWEYIEYICTKIPN